MSRFEGLKKEHEKMVDETVRRLIDLVDLGAAAGPRATRSPLTRRATDGEGARRGPSR